MEESFSHVRTGHLTRLYTGFKREKPNFVFFFHRSGGFWEAYFGDALLLAWHLDAPLDSYEGIPICRMDRATAHAYAHRLARDQWEVGFCEWDNEPEPEAKKMLDGAMET